MVRFNGQTHAASSSANRVVRCTLPLDDPSRNFSHTVVYPSSTTVCYVALEKFPLRYGFGFLPCRKLSDGPKKVHAGGPCNCPPPVSIIGPRPGTND